MKNQQEQANIQGDGAVEEYIDPRNFIYDEILSARAEAGDLEPLDWDKGFDIREKLGDDIRIKNQNSSLSCVGQGGSYYAFVKQVLEMINKHNKTLKELRADDELKKEVDEISAKAFYSQIYLPNGGAYIRRVVDLIINWGAIWETTVPSTNPETGIADEQFMREKDWKTKEADKIAEVYKGLRYALVKNNDIDIFARAILENDGVVGGLRGDNLTSNWGTEYPTPPTSEAVKWWAHCLFWGAFGKDKKMETTANPEGKFLATPNSWGTNWWKGRDLTWKPGDEPGKGWQKIGIEYIDPNYFFNGRTYVDKENIIKPELMENTFPKIIKDKNSKAVGFWLPATSPDALTSMALNFGKTIEKNEAGEIDWDKTIEGELELKPGE